MEQQHSPGGRTSCQGADVGVPRGNASFRSRSGRKLRREGLFRELKRRQAYEKPSERRARERIESAGRRCKALRKRLEREDY
jgi:small subunit ribosomal protein S21